MTYNITKLAKKNMIEGLSLKIITKVLSDNSEK